jgi:hypothetical protein
LNHHQSISRSIKFLFSIFKCFFHIYLKIHWLSCQNNHFQVIPSHIHIIPPYHTGVLCWHFSFFRHIFIFWFSSEVYFRLLEHTLYISLYCSNSSLSKVQCITLTRLYKIDFADLILSAYILGSKPKIL